MNSMFSTVAAVRTDLSILCNILHTFGNDRPNAPILNGGMATEVDCGTRSRIVVRVA